MKENINAFERNFRQLILFLAHDGNFKRQQLLPGVQTSLFRHRVCIFSGEPDKSVQ